jgi:archaellum biogenesis protein FlaJ (TadC family)
LGSLLIVSIVLVACVLNLDATFVHDIFLWARVLIPALLFVGLAGLLMANRMLFILASIVACVGIGLFFLVVIITRVPGELSRLEGGSQWPSQTFLEIRLLLLIALGIAVVVLFARLIKAAGFTNENAQD